MRTRNLLVLAVAAAIACAIMAVVAEDAMSQTFEPPLEEPADAPVQWRGELTICIEELACYDFTTEDTWPLEEQCAHAVMDNAQALDIVAYAAAPDRRRFISTNCIAEEN